jgi:hypothetical protein
MTTAIRFRAEPGEVPALIAECLVCGLFGVFHPVAEEELARSWVCRGYMCLKVRAERALRIAA